MGSKYTLYQGSHDWSALYEDGVLVKVGDHFVIDEFLREKIDLEVVVSDDFMRGGEDREAVGATLDEVKEWRSEALGEFLSAVTHFQLDSGRRVYWVKVGEPRGRGSFTGLVRTPAGLHRLWTRYEREWLVRLPAPVEGELYTPRY